MNRAPFFAAAVVLCSAPALADVTLVSEVFSQGKTRSVTLLIKGTKASFDMREEGGGMRRGMLRDSQSKKLWLIDHEKKSVIAMTEEDSKALEARQEQMRLQLKAQLDRLPPEQRTRMEQTMLAMPDPTAKPPTFTYKKKDGPERTIAGFKCQDHTIQRDGQPYGEGCFAPWNTVGVTAEQFKKLLLDAMPSAAAAGPMMQSFEAHANTPGLSVERTVLDASGQVSSRTTLKRFGPKDKLDAKEFELPKDYTEKSMRDVTVPGGPMPAPTPGPVKNP